MPSAVPVKTPSRVSAACNWRTSSPWVPGVMSRYAGSSPAKTKAGRLSTSTTSAPSFMVEPTSAEPRVTMPAAAAPLATRTFVPSS